MKRKIEKKRVLIEIPDMYNPKQRVPYAFTTMQINVLKTYYKNTPYLSIKYLRKIYDNFGKKVPLIHIKYWFVNQRNKDWFRRQLPKTNEPLKKLEIPNREVKRERERERDITTLPIKKRKIQSTTPQNRLSIDFLLN